jgi:putative ABC transport system permease protein
MHYAEKADRSLEAIIRQTDGVSGTYGIYQTDNVEIDGVPGGQIGLLQGADSNKYPEYWNSAFDGNKEALLQELNKGRNIIVSTMIRDKYNLKIGDPVSLRLKQTSKTYKIIGYVNTLMYNGNFAIVSESNFKMDTGIRYYSNIYIKTSKDPGKVYADLKKRLAQRPNYMITVSLMESENKKSNDNIFVIMKGFSLMALVIGIFGILNNLLISFIERKRSLAMLRSIGMSKRQTVVMIFIEALSGGFIGGVTGVIAGFFIIGILLTVLDAIAALHLRSGDWQGFMS